jgi:hypothetical protein
MPRKAINGMRYAFAAAIEAVVCWSSATYVVPDVVEVCVRAGISDGAGDGGGGGLRRDSSSAALGTSTPSLAASDANLAAAADVVAPAATSLGTIEGIDPGGHGLQPASIPPSAKHASFVPVASVWPLPPTITLEDRRVGTTLRLLTSPEQSQGPSLTAAVSSSCDVASPAIDLATARALELTFSNVCPAFAVHRLGTVTSPSAEAPPPPAVPSNTTALMHEKRVSASSVVAYVTAGEGPAMATITRRPTSRPE